MSERHREMLRRAERMENQLIEMRRDFHRHPELSGQEHRTTERIRHILQDAGIEVIASDLETGVIARTGSGEGPTVALRADLDALPLCEKTGLPFASAEPGVMHACGHDAHITWLLGAASILAQLGDGVRGEVRLLFQPAEEKTAGAEQLIHAGGLQGVQMIFGAHTKPDLPCGEVGVKSGYLMASTGSFELVIRGRGGHGAVPQATVDPIAATGTFLTALQSIVARNVDPLASAVISVGEVKAGTAGNVIPESATVRGTMRAFDPEVKELLTRRLQSLAHGVARAHDCQLENRRLAFGVPPVNNDPGATNVVRKTAEMVLGTRAVREAVPVLASEDFSLYQAEVPGCFFWIGTGNPDAGIEHGWHHPEFTVDEACLPPGAALLAATALEALDTLS